MPRTDEPSDVDFVVGEAEFEELAQPERREWPWLRQARVPLAIVAAIAVLAGLAVRGFADRSGSAAAPRPTPSTSFAITFPRPDVLPVDRHGNPPLPNDPSRCPVTYTCATTPDAPPDVLAAIQDAFPGARQLSATTVVNRVGLTGALWFRQVNARAGDRDILVRIQQVRRIPRDGRAGTTITDKRGITYVLTLSNGFSVQVQVDAPLRQTPAIQTLRRLTLDRRLFAAA